MFLQLTDLNDNKIFIKASEIVAIVESDKGTKVTTPYISVVVQDLPEDIYFELKELEVTL